MIISAKTLVKSMKVFHFNLINNKNFYKQNLDSPVGKQTEQNKND
jgi:hypothetical protein